ncbi:MAG TPA: GWxTD domain-containing protein [Bacteroidia bacterium]|nr:GWxTD domain-containing protein [Bacteroidia bacterium]
MKKLFLLVLVLFAKLSSFGALNAFFSYASFDQPDRLPFIETYLNINGKSVKLAKDEKGKFRSTLEIQWVFKQGDKIVHFDKYNLHSPSVDSITQPVVDFIDLQRVQLDTGNYKLELKIADKNSLDPPFSLSQDIRIFFPKDKVSISEIEFLESFTKSTQTGSFTKNGYEMVPYILGYYPAELKNLKFYAEIYRTKPLMNEDYLVRYFIANSENRVLQNDLVNLKKQSPAEINVILGEIPLDKLASGNYTLSIEVRNKENKLITYRQQFFQRSNPMTVPLNNNEIANLDVNNSFISSVDDPDSLVEYIACLAPISAPLEVQIQENQIALKDVQNMKQYILHFWTGRDQNNPAAAWAAYMAEVKKVNAAYGTLNKRGYEADRGRVYLQYGPPNTITADNIDPNAIPYEIWHYYKLLNQSNRKFVFYNPDGVSNDYRLLHSDANGELQDDAWELKLHSRSQQFYDQDQQKSQDIYGTKTKENFQNPK